MALADIVRSGIALAKSTLSTGELLSTVLLAKWASQNDNGEATYAADVAYEALVTNADDRATTQTGETSVARCKVMFLEDVAITPLDRVTLADGSTGPIVRIDEGVVDATGRMMVTVYLGWRR